ncbi:hypothetical protein J5N97_017098 [Dioscorea zingiberensis]|uniref:RNase H type-1 domain-containing protein n=1 Tax=Dioscorea zingiberensis TaxID=325984 RepID=A0A9D5CKM3_9LILI|nr:hypothetical protein J5N97_017098 [Dioscorea zingiberensis]
MMNQRSRRIPNGSRWVEIRSSFHPHDMNGTGGGFILRDANGRPLLAEAFPTNGFNALHAEALALRQTMEVMIEIGEENVVFCHGSPVLQQRMAPGAQIPSGRVGQVLLECFALQEGRTMPEITYWPRENLAAASWLAECGRRCQQRCRWTGPWPPELEALF